MARSYKAELEQALEEIVELKRQLEIAECQLNQILNEEDDGEEL